MKDKGVIIRAPFYKLTAKGDEWKLEVLGAPYGGQDNGKDSQGEFFSERTDFMMNIGDTRPAIYYHGMSPDGIDKDAPAVIGTATAVRRDSDGLWFEVVLDKTKELAKRIWEAAVAGVARASSGAINYLVRTGLGGELLTWPIGELSLIDAEGGRQPANQLAVAQLKSLYHEAGIQIPEAFTQGGEPEVIAVDDGLEHRAEERANNPEVKKTMKPEKNLNDALIEEALIRFEERQAEKAAKAAEVQEKEDAITAVAYAKGLAEGEAKGKTWIDGKESIAPVKTERLGMGEDAQMDAFQHWAATGDYGASKSLEHPGPEWDSKKANESTGADGEYLVPDMFYTQFVEMREPLSVPRRMGVRQITTSGKVLDIPAESTAMTKFVRTPEAGTFDSDDTKIAQNQVTLQKWTKALYMTEEFLSDQQSNFMTLFPSMVARAAAQTESYYFAVGTGSSQHEGIFTGGDTDALTFDSDSLGADSDGNLSADALHMLYYTLGEGYRSDGAWLMDSQTERQFLTLAHSSTKPGFVFSAADIASFSNGKVTFMGRPSFTQDDIPVDAAGVCFVMFGSPQYYALVDGPGLSVRRNPWDHMSSGLVSFYCSFRQSGKVLIENAWVGGVGS